MMLHKASRNRKGGRSSAFLIGVCLAFGTAIADINDWVFDTSERAKEVTSSRSASLSSAFESRSVSAFGSNEDAVDSRCGDSQESESRAIDSTSFGLRIIFR